MDLLPDLIFLDPMDRDYRGREDQFVDEIVELDKADIDNCDIVVANCWQPSWGTAMEIHYAHSLGKRIVVIMPPGVKQSPWLVYHVDAFAYSLEGAADYINTQILKKERV